MLRCEPYTKDRLSIFGDRDKYADLLKKAGCRWNSRMQIPGWNISSGEELRIKKLIGSINKEEELRSVISKAKNRKDQQKYHRAKSPPPNSPPPAANIMNSPKPSNDGSAQSISDPKHDDSNSNSNSDSDSDSDSDSVIEYSVELDGIVI